jgi:hypothetical protein
MKSSGMSCFLMNLKQDSIFDRSSDSVFAITKPLIPSLSERYNDCATVLWS